MKMGWFAALRRRRTHPAIQSTSIGSRECTADADITSTGEATRARNPRGAGSCVTTGDRGDAAAADVVAAAAGSIAYVANYTRL